MMQYGNLRSSFGPQGREYVTRWNPQTVPVVSSGSPISGLGGSSSPLASALMNSNPISQTPSDGGRDGSGPMPEGEKQTGVAAGAVPSFGNFDLSDITPTRSGLAGTAANIGATLASGSPVIGALANAGTAMATGTGTGKAIGSAGGGLLGGLLLGPIGAIGGSWLGGKVGGGFDPNYGGFETINSPAAVASAQQAALSNIESTEGGGGPSWSDTIAPGYVDANNTNAYSDIGLSSGGGGYDGGGYGAGMNDGSGSDAPGGFAKGGHVTRDRLIGPDPHGPDDGYAALDHGEFVIKASDVKKLGGPDKTRKRLAELLASK